MTSIRPAHLKAMPNADMKKERKSQTLIRMSISALLIAGLVGCAADFHTTHNQAKKDAMDELAKALMASAQRATEARMELANMQPVSAESAKDSPNIQMGHTSIIDIDFVGPVERSLEIVTGALGWEFNVQGKKTREHIVNLRHKNVEALTVLRDIGAQCGNYCDIHAQVIEGGRSAITLSFIN